MTQQSAFKNPYLFVPFKYGMVGGILSISLFVILLVLGENPLINGTLFSFFFIPIFVFFAIKEFKKYYNASYLHFWQGMTIGFGTYMVLSVVSALFIWVYLDQVDPQLLTDYIDDRVTLMQDSSENLIERLGQDTYDNSLASVRTATAYDLALDDFIRKVLAGFFITTVISVVMRQRPLTVNN
jgi:hypothetical protein